jgi:hypothetical protein
LETIAWNHSVLHPAWLSSLAIAGLTPQFPSRASSLSHSANGTLWWIG